MAQLFNGHECSNPQVFPEGKSKARRDFQNTGTNNMAKGIEVAEGFTAIVAEDGDGRGWRKEFVGPIKICDFHGYEPATADSASYINVFKTPAQTEEPVEQEQEPVLAPTKAQLFFGWDCTDGEEYPDGKADFQRDFLDTGRNDRAKGIELPAGKSATVFKHGKQSPDKVGWSKEFVGPVKICDFTGHSPVRNNQISNIEVYDTVIPEEMKAQLFNGPDCTEGREYPDNFQSIFNRDFKRTGLDNKAQGIDVPEGYSITVYQFGNRSGFKKTFTGPFKTCDLNDQPPVQNFHISAIDVVKH